MKVLLLSPLPPPVGGIASWTVNILRYYSDSANNLTELVHQNTAMRHRGITKKGIFSRLYSGIIDSLRIACGFFINYFKYKPDVIHVTSSASLAVFKDIIIAVLAKLFRVPMVIHYHFGRIPEIIDNNSWEWKILKIVTSLCSATIVLDEKSYISLKESGAKTVYIIPNPISAEIEQFFLKDTGYANTTINSKINIIFVGHIVINKGVLELVQACAQFNNIHELTLIGPYEKDTKQDLLEIAKNSNFLLNFTGVLDKETVLKKMSEASFLVLPSYTEGFPNVLLEAMAMKCPIIATDVGAISDMLDVNTPNPAGLVVEPKDVQALIEAMSKIMSDHSLSETLKQNAFIKVNEKYTLKNVCAQYEIVWNAAYQNRDA